MEKDKKEEQEKDKKIAEKKNCSCHDCNKVRQRRGFIGPAAGSPALERISPPLIRSPRQINQPLGLKRTEQVAKLLGLDKNLVFTNAQYIAFISGQGANGSGDPDAANLVNASVELLTNTCGNPYIRNINGKMTHITLASYGLIVNEDGILESPANEDAPTRQINEILVPVTGYLATWSRANGAERSLEMLYASAYSTQLPFGFLAQQQASPAQLARYRDCRGIKTVGMSIPPALWQVNFCLIYTLNPVLASRMPAFWLPIPQIIVKAMEESPTGQVQFQDYAKYLHYHDCSVCRSHGCTDKFTCK